MAGYDSKEFSKEFSRRTRENYKYIDDIVHRRQKISDARQALTGQYQEVIDKIDKLILEVRGTAKEISTSSKHNNKSTIPRQLFQFANILQTSKRSFEIALDGVPLPANDKNAELYEVTQLLNSLMGIAVLPYEMHKELFFPQKSLGILKNNEIELLERKNEELRNTQEYSDLLKEIRKLYNNGKWRSTYLGESKDDILSNDIIVFKFLGHLRNATCHSGNNALSILPLDEGKIIESVMFYDFYDSDNNREDPQHEFAMHLRIDDELKELLNLVESFYENTIIGTLDRTKKIEEAEARVNKLLGRK